MKKVIGWIALLLGAWITIAGILGTKSDQYQEESYYNGMYGNEAHSTVVMAILVGVALIIGGIYILWSISKTTTTTNQDTRIARIKMNQQQLDTYSEDENNLNDQK
ncbi:MAG TPA: hypothetical protein VGN87_04660 [Paenibacillus sp.]|jgi:NADH:ubiquinone oxidoreductase subunit 4 (subunit M)